MKKKSIVLDEPINIVLDEPINLELLSWKKGGNNSLPSIVENIEDLKEFGYDGAVLIQMIVKSSKE